MGDVPGQLSLEDQRNGWTLKEMSVQPLPLPNIVVFNFYYQNVKVECSTWLDINVMVQ